MNKSDYVRCRILNKTINPITDGKMVARQICQTEERLINCYNDVVNRFNILQNAINKQNEILEQLARQSNSSNDIKNVLLMNHSIMQSIPTTWFNDYQEKFIEAKESIYRIIAPFH